MPLACNPAELTRDDAPSSSGPVEDLPGVRALIEAEINTAESADALHPSIPALRNSNFSDLVAVEHARIASGAPKTGGLDLARYELPDAPQTGDLAGWRTALQKAYASVEYLQGRHVNLSLLEAYGKNAWLIGNSQLEDQLRYLERELEESKIELEQVEQARQAVHSNAIGEKQSLESAWRVGVGRMLETQAAGEKLRIEILDQKRQGAA